MMPSFKELLEEYEHDRDQAEKTLRDLDGAIRIIRRKIEADVENPYASMTIRDAAVNYLAFMEQPLSTKELVDALMEGGLNLSTKTPYQSIHVALTNGLKAGEFVRSEGQWSLPPDHDSEPEDSGGDDDIPF